ncbi:ribokinase, partial [Pedobacter sp. HMWF019]|uniref:ribokinase n=1 Tax=Pedobacter sp. HMWF019 TaxID=2056856 RepID=UPI000D399E4C
HIPVPGETVLGGSFFMNPGGKGANQAVAVARLGGDVTFVSKMGNDVFGKQSFQLMDKEGIDTRYIVSDEELPSGVALITVDASGENSIVVAQGANGNLLVSDIEPALNEIEQFSILLLQLEIPMSTVEFITFKASEKNILVILNPAPATKLSDRLLQHIDIITPNESEASILSGIAVTDVESAKKAAQVIHELGIKSVIITLGPLGALVLDHGAFHLVPAKQVETVDSTAAGDVFNGGLAVALAEGKSLVEAVDFACEAAAFSVTRLGAQSSIPHRNELLAHKLKH